MVAVVGAAALHLAVAPPASATEQVNACAGDPTYQNNIFKGTETFGIKTYDACGQPGGGIGLLQDNVHQEQPGQLSSWVANAPDGLAIVTANVPVMNLYNATGTGYVAYFIWGTGYQQVTNQESFYVTPNPPAPAFGFYLGCSPTGSICPKDGAEMNVQDIHLTVEETVSPSITPIGSNNLWYKGASEYVRGSGWSAEYSATAPSGIESMSASENSTAITSSLPPSCWPDGTGPNHTVWQQCQGTQTWSPTVSLAGNGNQQLTLAATSAAQNASSPTETIHVDSTQPTISLSGPAQASSTAGMQYVTATASVGPSGLGSISCSTDGARAKSYSSSPASIPVSGLGMHSVQCTATNRSYDAAGQSAPSTPATWQLDIAQPTVSGIAFTKLVDQLRCKLVEERVKVPAKWVAVVRHGGVVQVRRRAHTKFVKVIKCHPRIVRRKVTVWVNEKRHGRTVRVKRKRVVRVALLPHLVGKGRRRVAYGRGTSVSGWLGTSSDTALGGRTVQVMTSPDNARGVWTQAAVVATAPDGTWTAQLPAGPSRLVEARYNGDVTTEPSVSNAIHLIVPAKVKLRIRPRHVAWGGTIRISGRVLGGYIPRGKLLRLRIGVAGIRETVGIPNVRRNGRFHTTWTFASGNGVVRYWFSISTLNEADYPFAPGSSRRVYVTVGPG